MYSSETGNPPSISSSKKYLRLLKLVTKKARYRLIATEGKAFPGPAGFSLSARGPGLSIIATATNKVLGA